MAAAFKSRGVSLPPWRTLKAIRSKWNPVTSHAVSVLDNSSAPSAAPQSQQESATTEQPPATQPPAATPHKQPSSGFTASAAASVPIQRPAVSSSKMRGIAQVKAVTAAPWRVQTGFQVSDVPAPLPASAAGVSAVKRAPVSSAFDMWSHQPRQQQSGMSVKCRKVGFCAPPLDDRLSGVMAPIRTVKMCGRTKA